MQIFIRVRVRDVARAIGSIRLAGNIVGKVSELEVFVDHHIVEPLCSDLSIHLRRLLTLLIFHVFLGPNSATHLLDSEESEENHCIVHSNKDHDPRKKFEERIISINSVGLLILDLV